MKRSKLHRLRNMTVQQRLDMAIENVKRRGRRVKQVVINVDAFNTLDFNEYFVILPSTQLWEVESFRTESNSRAGRNCETGFSYNSGTNERFLTIEELRELTGL